MRVARGNAARARRAGAAAALASLLAFAVPALARAEVKAIKCGELQSTVTSLGILPAHGEGETLVLSELCTSASLGASGITVPAGVTLTLQGAPGSGAGIDGTGISGPLLAGSETGAVSLEGLTFEHASTTSAAEGAVSLRAARVTIAGDEFIENSEAGVLGAGLFVGEYSKQPCPGAGAPPRLDVRGSVFRGNSLTVGGGVGGGAAAFLVDNCPTAVNLIEGNVIEDNVLRANGSEKVLGAGFEVISESPQTSPLTQRGNVFAGNRIELIAGSGSYGGAGEWLEGISATSIGDRFSGNEIPGASGAGHWSWGAGLGVISCASTGETRTTLEDGVLAANLIAGGEAADARGAGVYVGCPKGAPNHLSLLDSTVTANSAPGGGTAGVAGGTADSLLLGNSIVAADIGNDLSGFNGGGGSIAASFSDACTPGTASPLPGEGNICSAPALADAGNPASADVHETAQSPTVEAGSNALVPPGLTTDFYGAPRIQGGSFSGTCSPGSAPHQLAAAVVDMGAAESSFSRIVEPPCAPVFQRSSFTFPHVSVLRGGVLVLTFHNLGKSTLLAQAHVRLRETVVVKAHGHRRRVHRTVSVLYAQAGRTGTLPSPLRLRLVPRKRALQALRRLRHLSVSLSVTYAANRLFPDTQTRTVKVRWIAPPKHHR